VLSPAIASGEHSKLRAKLDFTKKHLVYRKNLLQNNL
jgi:hypothetical protein